MKENDINIRHFLGQVFKNTAAMMHMGNMTKDFVPVGKVSYALNV